MILISDRALLDAISLCTSAAARESDPIKVQTLGGFLCVAAGSAIESCVRTEYLNFAALESAAFEAFVENHFEKFNARIRLHQIAEDFTQKIGGVYYKRFVRMRAAVTTSYIRRFRADPFAAYSNLVQWRHSFVHERTLPPATLDHIVMSIFLSEAVMQCLHRSLSR